MRTDIHAPKNLCPEDYDLLGVGNYATRDLDAYSPLNTPRGRTLLDEGWRFAGNEAKGDCYHCGHSPLTYFAILMHRPSKAFIRVGETCLDNRFGLANAEFQKLRKEAKLNRERRALREKRDEFLLNDNARTAYDWAKANPAEGRRANDPFDEESFNEKFVRFIDRYGEASEKFVASVLRAKERQAEWEAKREAERASSKPVLEGRITIEGTVLSTKLKPGFNGEDVLKMRVRDDRGFTVWGTVPSSIVSLEKDQRVRFTASVTKSNDDDTFGFFKRPSKAEIL